MCNATRFTIRKIPQPQQGSNSGPFDQPPAFNLLHLRDSPNQERTHQLLDRTASAMYMMCPTSTLFFLYTVEIRWLEHLWDPENMFATRVVRATEC